MRRVLAGVAVAVVAVGLVFGLSRTAGATTVNPDYLEPVLPSGHCLVADHSFQNPELVSPSGRISLEMYWEGQLDLNDEVPVKGHGSAGAQFWFGAYIRHGITRTTLCMQRNGNLVLRQNGHTVWSTHTADKAGHGSAHVLDNGALVVRNASNKTVWSTHSTAILFVAGDRLLAGHSLVDRTYPHSWTTLQMRRSGDLVLLRNHQVVWRTGTHTPGSYLLVTTTGRIDILDPAHHVIWRSRAVGRSAVFMVDQHGRITMADDKDHRCWQRPVHAEPSCFG